MWFTIGNDIYLILSITEALKCFFFSLSIIWNEWLEHGFAEWYRCLIS